MRQTDLPAASAALLLLKTGRCPLARACLEARKWAVGTGVEITGIAETCTKYAEVAERAKRPPSPLSLADSRLVVHIQTSEQAIVDFFLTVICSLAEKKRTAEFVRSVGKAGNSSYKDTYAQMK